MTAWTPGQWVQASNGDERFWNAAAWATGRAPAPLPLATGATAGSPGTYTPAGSRAPVTEAEIITLVATPDTAWATDEYVIGGDASATEYHWGGSEWYAGQAP